MSNTLSEGARALLAELHFGVLATINPDGSPHLTTMWYELQGDEVLMNTKAGRQKEPNMRRDPRVALCVEDGYRYVTLAGTIRLIEDQPTAQADIKRLALRYLDAAAAEPMIQRFAGEQRITLRLTIEHVSEHL